MFLSPGYKRCMGVIFFGLLACTLAGQEGSIEDLGLTGLSLQELFDVEITIASMTEERVDEAPSAVAVFTRLEIEKMGITSLRQLLNFVPGFQSTLIVADGPSHLVHVRGRSRAGTSPDVLFLVDGQRLNDSHTGAANEFSRLLTIGNVKQVEVIRGPGSALYGSNAFLGVVNVVTETNHNQAGLRFGEDQFSEAYLNYSHRFGAFQLSLFGSAFEDDGQTYHLDLGQTTDPREGADLYATLESERLTFRLRFQERHFEDFINFGVVDNDVNFNTTWETSGNATWRILDRDDLKVKTTVNYMRHRWRSLTKLAEADGVLFPVDFLAGPVYWNLDYSASVDLDWKWSPKHQFLAGAFYRDTENQNLGAYTTYKDINNPVGSIFYEEPRVVRSAIPNGEVDRQIWGAYFQNKFELDHNFTLFLGARFDSYSDVTDGDTFNPRLGLIYSTPTNGYFKLLFGSAFRAPSFSELYLNSPAVASNEELKPEEVSTLEAVYIQDFEYKGRIALTLFRNDIDSAIVVTRETTELEMERFQNTNSGEAEIAGIEVESSWSPNEDMLVKLAFTRIFHSEAVGTTLSAAVEDTLPQPSESEPSDNDSASRNTFRSYGSLILNYRRGSWNFNLNGIYRGKIEAFSQQGSYGLLNAKVSMSLNPAWKLELMGHNVLDKRYLTFDETFTQGGFAVPNRGRETWFGARYNF